MYGENVFMGTSFATTRQMMESVLIEYATASGQNNLEEALCAIDDFENDPEEFLKEMLDFQWLDLNKKWGNKFYTFITNCDGQEIEGFANSLREQLEEE